MPNGRVQLRAWLERSNQNQNWLARAIGISDGYLSQILAGLRRPKLETLKAIEGLTGIPIGSWVDTDVATSGKRSKTGVK